MQENQTRWVNLSLYERPAETAIVCGYITDTRKQPTLSSMANVSLSWEGTEHQYYQNDHDNR